MALPETTQAHWAQMMDLCGPTKDSTYLRPLAALALFDQSEKRVRGRGGWIKVSGRWLQLNRTDLMADVRTGRWWSKAELEEPGEIIGYYRQKIRWGARLTKRLWCSIDSVSDG